MPSPVINVSQLSRAIQYMGSNSADIDTQVPNVSIISESGGTLVLDTPSGNVTVTTGSWVIYSVNGVSSMGNAQFLNEWACVAVCSQVGTGVSAIGIAGVPTLDPSDSALVPVLLSPPMPDSDYTAFVSKVASINTSDLAVNSVTVVDADTVNVLVQNMGPDPISGASIMVHAIAN